MLRGALSNARQPIRWVQSLSAVSSLLSSICCEQLCACCSSTNVIKEMPSVPQSPAALNAALDASPRWSNTSTATPTSRSHCTARLILPLQKTPGTCSKIVALTRLSTIALSTTSGRSAVSPWARFAQLSPSCTSRLSTRAMFKRMEISRLQSCSM